MQSDIIFTISCKEIKYAQFLETRCPTTAPSAAHSTIQAQVPDSHSGAPTNREKSQKPQIRMITKATHQKNHKSPIPEKSQKPQIKNITKATIQKKTVKYILGDTADLKLR